MCFGNTTTSTQTQAYQANPAVAGAAQQNLADTSKLEAAGYTPYTGQRVADFSNLQNTGFATAANAPQTNPFSGDAASLIGGYATAGPQSVNANPIWSQMSPYMNQYVMQALAPQLEAQNQQFAGQNKQLDAAATSAGAYGDSRAGIEAANLTQQQDIARTGLIGQAYNAAFNTAIGAGAQDVSNQMAAQGQTGQFAEQALGRELGGANALTNLGQSNLGYAQTASGLDEAMGGLQQQQQQAELNVPYSNYLAAQQYPFLTSAAMNAAINSGSSALKGTTTTTTQQPNNAGYALLGAALGDAGKVAMTPSDRRIKKDIKQVGTAPSGVPVKSFKFKHDPVGQTHVGVVAQDVEKRRPEAVHTDPVTGLKSVNLHKAVAPRRVIDHGRAFGDAMLQRAA